MADFNIGDPGVAITLRVLTYDANGNLIPDPIPAGSTNIKITFLGEKTQHREQFTATSIDGGLKAQYVTTGSDFTVADMYDMQLLYQAPGAPAPTSSVDPDARIVVRARL